MTSGIFQTSGCFVFDSCRSFKFPLCKGHLLVN